MILQEQCREVIGPFLCNVIIRRNDLFIIGRQKADDYICGCVVNSSWGWE